MQKMTFSGISARLCYILALIQSERTKYALLLDPELEIDSFILWRIIVLQARLSFELGMPIPLFLTIIAYPVDSKSGRLKEKQKYF